MLSFRFFLGLLLMLPWAVRPQSITTDKTSYAVGEPIEISWSYRKKLANSGDWIGIYDDASLSQGTLSFGSEMWVYAKSLTQTFVKGKRTSGTVTFDENPPDESQSSSWPLGIGTYQVHLIRNTNTPYSVVVSSPVFTVTPQSTKFPTKFPTLPVS